MKSYDLDSIFTFGKFKGKSLEEILSIQTSYIKWCILNVAHFVLTQETLEQILLQETDFKLTATEEKKRKEKELKWDQQQQCEPEGEPEYHNPNEYSVAQLEHGNWDYDPMNPAHN